MSNKLELVRKRPFCKRHMHMMDAPVCGECRIEELESILDKIIREFQSAANVLYPNGQYMFEESEPHTLGDMYLVLSKMTDEIREARNS